MTSPAPQESSSFVRTRTKSESKPNHSPHVSMDFSTSSAGDKGRFVFHRKLELEDLTVVGVEDSKSNQFSFELLSPDKSFAVVACESPLSSSMGRARNRQEREGAERELISLFETFLRRRLSRGEGGMDGRDKGCSNGTSLKSSNPQDGRGAHDASTSSSIPSSDAFPFHPRPRPPSFLPHFSYSTSYPSRPSLKR